MPYFDRSARHVRFRTFSTVSRFGLATLFAAMATLVLPTASAPVAAAAGTSFGATTPGTSIDTPGANYKFGSTFTLQDRAVMSDFKFYAKGGAASQSFVPVVYNVDSAGNPTTLVAQAKAVTVAASQPVGWVTSLLPAITVNPGKYHLALLAGANNAAASLYYTTAAAVMAWNANTYPTPSGSWGAVNRGNNLYSFAVDYTLAAPADTTPPTSPTLSGTATSSTQANLTWSASTDNVGVSKYLVLRGGAVIGSSTTTGYADGTLAAGTSYSYQVKAQDAAGNTSLASNTATVTTPAPAPDTAPPTTPSNLTATTPSSTQVALSWASSTDSGGSGLAGYRIYRADKGSAPYAVIPGGCCSWSEGNLTASTAYSYSVSAYDNAGNESPHSGPVNVTTPAAAGTAKPGPSNTGVPAGTALTVFNGTLNITADGTVIDGKDIRGFVVIAANNVTIRRSIVHGGVATGNTGVIRSTSGCGILVEDSEITADNPSAVLDDIWAGCNFTGRRLNIHGGVDGIHAGTNARIENSWIHGMSYFSSDPNHGGGPTHNDGIQIFNGSGIVISSNNLEMIRSNNAAVQITQDFGPVTGVSMQNNWADGGACTLNISHNNGPTPMRGVSATGNRFGRNSYFGCPMLISTQTVLTQSGNVYDDNGQSVPIQQHD